MKIKDFIGGFAAGFILAFGIMFYFGSKEPSEPETIPINLEQPEFFLEDKPTNNLLLEACEYYGIEHSDIVVAQAILETGHYKSEKCVNDNNLFGLYNSYKKEYYKFEHWTESVKAYRDKIQYRYVEGDYYQWLKDIGYATDSLYIPKIKDIKNRYKL